MTKKEIIKELKKLRVKHDPKDHYARLAVLLRKAKETGSEPPGESGVEADGLKGLIVKLKDKHPGLAVDRRDMTIINEKGNEEKIECYSIVDNGGKFLTRGIRWRGLVDEAGIREALEVLITGNRELFLTTPYLMKCHKVDRLVD